jgi:hypothetical protein
MRKQITTKLKALEDAHNAYETASKKYQEHRVAAQKKYEKDLQSWNSKVAKALLKAAAADTIRLELRGYHNNFSGVNIFLSNVDLSAFGEQPSYNHYDHTSSEAMKLTELRNNIPQYYDSYHREVYKSAVIFHFKKSLDMLDVLPQGTTTITVKDYNFLTRF